MRRNNRNDRDTAESKILDMKRRLKNISLSEYEKFQLTTTISFLEGVVRWYEILIAEEDALNDGEDESDIEEILAELNAKENGKLN